MKQEKERWQLVAFISVETGHDLIVAFAVCKPDDPTEIETLTILRTPRFERFLYEWERGAKVSFERDPENDEVILLKEVVYAPDSKRITLRTDDRTYKLDLRKVDPKELSAMGDAFRKMNFDSSILLTGL